MEIERIYDNAKRRTCNLLLRSTSPSDIEQFFDFYNVSKKYKLNC